MPMNRQSGNMYLFVTHTWNPIRGKCPHNCYYCYMRRFKLGELRLEQKELKTDLGSDNYIFVGSSTDMFAAAVPSEWIADVLIHCNRYPNNTYLFQSKNPQRFQEFQRIFPKNTILGTTIESNRIYKISGAPGPSDRQWHIQSDRFDVMISIEPILDFDLDVMVNWIKDIGPKFVSIGADSKNHDLPEPSADKIQQLIKELRTFTEVREKNNLKRLTYG